MKKILLPVLFLLISSLAFSQSWSSVGTQSYSPGNTFSLCIYRGNLFAGVSNIVACSPHGTIIRWNGSSWVSDSSLSGFSINTFTVFNNTFIVGGSFSTPTQNVAQWNGATWLPMGGGTLGTNAFVNYNGTLYSGGLSDFEMWDGRSWGVADNHAINSIYALASYNGQLYAGGEFSQVCGSANYVAVKQDSCWAPVDGGINGTVYAITTFNGKLYAGGFFDSAGGKPVSNIAVWNDTAWEPLGAGVNGIVLCMQVLNGQLFVGGEFDSAGGQTADYIAAWDGKNWSGLGSGLNNYVYTLATNDTVLYAGGEFTTAGGSPANNIARWTPSPAGINELKNNVSVTVYPNPTSGLINFVLNNAPQTQKRFLLFNVLGEEVFTGDMTSSDEYSINLSSQPTGAYLYKIVSTEGLTLATGKLLIQ